MYPGSLPSSLGIQDEGRCIVMLIPGECQYSEVYPRLSLTSVINLKLLSQLDFHSTFRKPVSLALPKS